MYFERRPKLKKVVTDNRLRAAARANTREQYKSPLFAQQIANEQDTPEERIDKMFDSVAKQEARMRKLLASFWVKGRRMLASMNEVTRQSFLAKWNSKKYPGSAEFFVDLVRSHQSEKKV